MLEIFCCLPSVLKYITSETTLKPDTDHNNPDKAAIDKEKEMLEKYKVRHRNSILQLHFFHFWVKIPP